ncbi:hypothetical protein QBC37DRAFT_273195 [Rhypophila decipiens]|uniref:Uncharacterized protein n=1 Tax=Rhypophila decipiens TaxID=261697 RepID=A0AAN6YJQ2_9PEZI|nr:hypothetical protein QBC37DRAFT_273195 [Rhypophila decipiens]
MRLVFVRQNPALSICQQCRYQGTTGQDRNNTPKSSKPQAPPPLTVGKFILRSFLGSVRSIGTVFKSETLRKTYQTNPISLVTAFFVLGSVGVIMIYVVYIYFTYFNGEHFTRYPEPVAAALRKALYFTNVDQDPKRALKYYKQALALCDELNIDPFTDEVIGIKLQVSHWLQTINNQANAVQVLESLLADCKRWIEKAENAIKDGTVPPSLMPPSNLKDKEEKAGSKQEEEAEKAEPKAPENIWGKRNRILQKAVQISVKLAELYNDDHLLKPDIAHERLIWGVETSLKELARRTTEGIKPGEGNWMNAEEHGAALESLAHSYETRDLFELALPLFFQALGASRDQCHSAVLMNNIAVCFAQHNVGRPGVAAIDKTVVGEKSGSSATPAERRAAYLAAAQRWAANAKQHATEPKGEQRTAECDEACAVSLCNLGDIASLTGKPAEARQFFEQAIAMSKKIGYTPAITQAEAGLENLSKTSS